MPPEKLERFSGQLGVTLFVDGVPHHSCRLCGTATRIPDLAPAKRFKELKRITVEKKAPILGMVGKMMRVTIPKFGTFDEVCFDCREALNAQERDRRSKGEVTAQRRRQARTEYF